MIKKLQKLLNVSLFAFSLVFVSACGEELCQPAVPSNEVDGFQLGNSGAFSGDDCRLLGKVDQEATDEFNSSVGDGEDPLAKFR